MLRLLLGMIQRWIQQIVPTHDLYSATIKASVPVLSNISAAPSNAAESEKRSPSPALSDTSVHATSVHSAPLVDSPLPVSATTEPLPPSTTAVDSAHLVDSPLPVSAPEPLPPSPIRSTSASPAQSRAPTPLEMEVTFRPSDAENAAVTEETNVSPPELLLSESDRPTVPSSIPTPAPIEDSVVPSSGSAVIKFEEGRQESRKRLTYPITRRTVSHLTPDTTPEEGSTESELLYREVVQELLPPQALTLGKPISEWFFEVNDQMYDCILAE
jgi:hypothetical protein